MSDMFCHHHLIDRDCAAYRHIKEGTGIVKVLQQIAAFDIDDKDQDQIDTHNGQKRGTDEPRDVTDKTPCTTKELRTLHKRH
jgi:hypothetical protein